MNLQEKLTNLISKLLEMNKIENATYHLNSTVTSNHVSYNNHVTVDMSDKTFDELKLADIEYLKQSLTDLYKYGVDSFKVMYDDGDEISYYIIETSVVLPDNYELRESNASPIYSSDLRITLNPKDKNVRLYALKPNDYNLIINNVQWIRDIHNALSKLSKNTPFVSTREENFTTSLFEDVVELKKEKWFESFLKDSFDVEEQEYLFVSSNTSQYVVEHIGYDFCWNDYYKPRLDLMTKIIHSYDDLEWDIALCSDVKDNITSFGTRVVSRGDNHVVVNTLRHYTKNVSDTDLFSYLGVICKLYVTKGLIDKIKITDDNIYGLSSTNKVVFLYTNDEYPFTDIKIDEQELIMSLNKIIGEFNV